jgi:hypothetical protein
MLKKLGSSASGMFCSLSGMAQVPAAVEDVWKPEVERTRGTSATVGRINRLPVLRSKPAILQSVLEVRGRFLKQSSVPELAKPDLTYISWIDNLPKHLAQTI